MSWLIVLLVLCGALLHASWNALIKSGRDQQLDTALIHSLGCGIGVVLVVAVGFPRAEALPWLAVSLVIHIGYYITLVGAYRHGDLGFAYPIMRGTAPLLVAVLGIAVLHEMPSPHALLGILLICTGIVSIAFVRRGRHSRAAAGWAFTNACVIAAYTLVDGSGARASGNPIAYVTWLITIEGLPFIAWILWRGRRTATAYLGRSWRRGLLGGAASLGAYGIVLFAMTRAPVAAVAALRETSVLFAALIGALWLKEGFGAMRLAGAASVAVGIAALKL